MVQSYSSDIRNFGDAFLLLEFHFPLHVQMNSYSIFLPDAPRSYPMLCLTEPVHGPAFFCSIFLPVGCEKGKKERKFNTFQVAKSEE